MSNQVDNSHKDPAIAANIEPIDTNPPNLKVESVIQYGEPAQCGVIKWIGSLPGETEVYAGVEMVINHLNGYTYELQSIQLATCGYNFHIAFSNIDVQ